MIWKKFKEKKDPQQRISLCYEADQIVVVGASYAENNSLPKIIFFQQYGMADKDTIQADLKTRHLEGIPATIVLPSGYQIALVDFPRDVNLAQESTLRHYAAEYVEGPIQDAVIDYIEIPEKQNKGGTKKYYLVTASKTFLHNITDKYQKLGFKIRNVQVVESALKELAIRLEDNQEGEIFIFITTQKAYIILVRDSVAYMMRSIEFTRLNGQQFSNEIAEEVQRTLDYCNASVSKFIGSRIVLASAIEIPEDTLSVLSDLLGLPGRRIHADELFELQEGTVFDAKFAFVGLGGLFVSRGNA